MKQTNTNNLKALKVATEAHGSINQKRKLSGADYVTHPIAVAKLVEQHGGTDEMIQAALLHDILEDVYPKNKYYSPEFIKQEFGDKVLKLVEELTDAYSKEKFPVFNRKTRHSMENKRISLISNEAKTIKLADVIHNCSEAGGLGTWYIEEKKHQLEFLKGGNSVLYKKAHDILYKS